MPKIIELDRKRNLYYVDDMFVVLARTEQDARRCVQNRKDSNEYFEVELIDENKILNVIHSGKNEIIIWKRDLTHLEKQRISFNLSVRKFIDSDLKSLGTPSIIDVIEDRGAITPRN